MHSTRNRLSGTSKLDVLQLISGRRVGLTIRQIEEGLPSMPATTVYRALHALTADRLLEETHPDSSAAILAKLKRLAHGATFRLSDLNHYRITAKGAALVKIIRHLAPARTKRPSGEVSDAINAAYGLARDLQPA
jgi:hypothetical protein